jgi:hypothetical protein
VRRRLGPEDRDIFHGANAAATTNDLKATTMSAQIVGHRAIAAQSAAVDTKTDNDISNVLLYALLVPWQQHVLDPNKTSCLWTGHLLNGHSRNGFI